TLYAANVPAASGKPLRADLSARLDRDVRLDNDANCFALSEAWVQGWIRTTEVTRGRDGSAHPHFHTLMMVPPSMLSGRDYVKQY
ncbi:ROK family protein, partial [Salmonella enterica subsp. enterica serovar Kentucky]|nr:ROK family protein [Salmonella enterica subsp. enterica serovar Kentucky]